MKPQPFFRLSLAAPLALATLLTLQAGCDFHASGYPDTRVPVGTYSAPSPGGGGGWSAPASTAPQYTPDAVEPGCGAVTEVGQCDGDVLRFCHEGTTYTYDCLAYGLECGWDTTYDFFECLPVGTSSAPPPSPPAGSCSVGLEGACSYDVLTYCYNGKDVVVDCAARGEICAFVEDNAWFDCVDPILDPVVVPDPGPAGCGGVSTEGFCDADILTYCQDGEVVVVDCAASGALCTYDGTAGYFDCVAPEEPVVVIDECGDIGFEGLCDGDTVMWCEDGQLKESTCTGGCGWNEAAGYYDCLEAVAPAEGCGDVTFEGTCEGDTVLWCEDGALQSSTCEHGCGWNEGAGYYDCL